MDANEFIKELVSSYPQGLRPDVDFLSVIQKEIKKKQVPSFLFEDALSVIRQSFRMFPTLSDVNWAFTEALQKRTRGKEIQKAYEYFEIDGKSYRRDVRLTPEGDIVRDCLPLGAVNYHLHLPENMEADRNFINAEQAYAEGCISEELYRSIRSKDSKHPYKGRFKKIGELLEQEKKQKEEEFINDSMAANPEEPICDPYGDI